LIATIQDHAVDEIGQNAEVVHALWTLHGRQVLDGKDPDANRALLVALEHPSAGVRRNAVAVLPRNEQFSQALLKSGALRSRDAQVQLSALLALAEMPPSEEAAEAIRVAFASAAAEDRWLNDALIAAAAQHDVQFLRAVARNSGGKLASPPGRALSIVSEHYARSAPADTVGSVIELLASAAPNDAAARIIEPILTGFAKGWPKGKPARLSADTEKALVKLVTTAPSSVRGLLANLASRWGSQALEAHVAEIAQGFESIVLDDKASDATRVTAAKQLIDFRKSAAEPIATLAKLITPRTSAELANGLVEAIGASDADTADDTLIASWPTLTPSVRQTALRALLARADWTRSLIAACESGQIELSDLSLEQKQALANHPDKEVAARVKPLLARGGGLPNPDRQKVIDELLPVIEQSGDAVNGKAVFKKTCAKCHTHSGEGTKIGPDLTGMAVHPKHELIIHILDPSRSVEGNFRIYTVQTDDGKVFTGLLASESKTAIELIDVEAKKHTILRENIEELIASKKSLMPEGVEKLHTPAELRDLLEFLTQRGKFLPIPLEKVATISTATEMFHDGRHDEQKLIFSDWKPKVFEGVPFVLIDPQGGKTNNAVMLQGTNGDKPPRMPRSVTLPCNAPAKTIHFLGGISGWGWPASEKGTASVTVRLKYADGQTEDHRLINGEHFADYIRRVDVPQSKFAFAVRGQQVRYFTVTPQRPDKIETIDLIKGRDVTSPVFLAITVEAP
jgi:putative heme-binding domain-containing protein